MSAPSTFQRLPLHIAENIARFYTYKDDMPNDSDFIYMAKHKDAWLVLHGVSYSWRMLALRYFCSKVRLEVSARATKKTFSFTQLPRSLRRSVERNRHVNYRYVKRVSIVLFKIKKRPSVEQHHAFQMVWPEKAIFPSARSLSICIEGKFDQPIINGIAIESEVFDWVAQRLLTALPRLQEARIEHIFRSLVSDFELVKSINQDANRLFLTIFEKVKKLNASASSVCLVPNDQYLQNSPGLTSLEYDCFYDINFLPFIIQRSACTLESLTIQHFPMESIRTLVYGDDSKAIVYPRLRKLDFSEAWSFDSMRKVRVDKSITPFPELRYLRWAGRRAYEDDTLFRGNADKLEYLNIRLDTEFVSMLQGASVFSNGNHSKLCCIITNTFNARISESATYDLLSCFTGRLVSSATQAFVTRISYSYQNIMSIVSASSYAGNIKVLMLRRTALSLLQVIELLKRLPQITDLTCGCRRLDLELGSQSCKTITDRLHTENYPLSRCFKYWDITDECVSRIESLAISAIALAILCPSLAHILISCEEAESHRSEANGIIASGLYDEHAGRLMNLFS